MGEEWFNQILLPNLETLFTDLGIEWVTDNASEIEEMSAGIKEEIEILYEYKVKYERSVREKVDFSTFYTYYLISDRKHQLRLGIVSLVEEDMIPEALSESFIYSEIWYKWLDEIIEVTEEWLDNILNLKENLRTFYKLKTYESLHEGMLIEEGIKDNEKFFVKLDEFHRKGKGLLQDINTLKQEGGITEERVLQMKHEIHLEKVNP